jgi:hypothetical protein
MTETVKNRATGNATVPNGIERVLRFGFVVVRIYEPVNYCHRLQDELLIPNRTETICCSTIQVVIVFYSGSSSGESLE